MPHKKLTLRILLFLVSADILETFTQFCFKKSVIAQANISVNDLRDAIFFIKGAFASPFIWAGLLSVIVTFIIWSTILSKIDLSVAVPAASFSYILVPLVSVIFLHEEITFLRWAGIFLILMGVIFVSLSSTEKESSLL